MSEKIERDFKGIWIPKKIWLDKNLTLNEKVFLVEIDSLDNEDGCFATNEHFSVFFGLSKNRCSEIIKSLEKKKFISIEYKYFPGKKSIEKRIITVLDISSRGIRKTDRGIREIDLTYSENREDNNTLINNTINNTIYSHWNTKNIINHKKMNTDIETAINKALKAYTEDEIIKAIDTYKEILDSKYYFSFKWSLKDFLNRKNGISTFMEDGTNKVNYEEWRTSQNGTDRDRKLGQDTKTSKKFNIKIEHENGLTDEERERAARELI